MESFKKAIKFWSKDEKPDSMVEEDLRLENWNVPIACTALPDKPQFHDKDIPVSATSYALDGEIRLFQRIRLKVEGEVQKRIVNPIFRRETLSGHVWKNDVESRASFIALAFSASLLFRFPYVCMKYGGGFFILVYILLVIFVMQPLIFMSIVLGRLSRELVEKYPIFAVTSKRIPIIYFYMSLILLSHNNIILSYSAVYVVAQILETSPAVCTVRMKSNSECIPYEDINPADPERRGIQNRTISSKSPLSTELFFRQYVQGERLKSGGLYSQMIDREWRFLTGVGIVFIIMALLSVKHIVSKFSRVLFYGTFLLPVLLTGLLVLQLFWIGAFQGLFQYFFDLRWMLLGSVGFWIEVWSMAFTTCMPGYGVINYFARYKTSVRGLYALSWLYSVYLILLTGLAFALVATETGVLEKISQINNYFDTVTDQLGIAFICMSNVLLKIPTKWPCVAFFCYATVFGIWTQIVMIDACIGHMHTLIHHACPAIMSRHGVRIYHTTLILILSMMLLVVYGSREGPAVLDAYYVYAAPWAACAICMAQVYSATKHYGVRMFFVKAEVIMRKPPPRLFITEMRYTVLPFLVIGFLPMTVYLFSFESIGFLSPPGKQPGPELMLYGFALNILPVLVLAVYIARTKRFTRRKKPKVMPLTGAPVRSKPAPPPPPPPVIQPSSSGEGGLKISDSRFFERRASLTSITSEHEPRLVAIVHRIQRLEEERRAAENNRILREQRGALEKLLWKKLFAISAAKAKVKTVSKRMLEKHPMAESYFRRFTPMEIHQKDIQYLTRLLRSFDVYSAFVSARVIIRKDEERARILMQRILMAQTNLEDTLYIDPDPHKEVISIMLEKPISDRALRVLYADHILQELGEPYSHYCDGLCRDFLRPSDVLAIDPMWLMQPIHDEYSIHFEGKSVGSGRFNVIIIESITHALLDRLPELQPPVYRLRKSVIDPLSTEKQMKFICSNIPPEHFLPDSGKDTAKLKFSRAKDYTKRIQAQPFARRFDFLQPDKVCIVILVTPEDEEMLSVLRKNFVHPKGKLGYIQVPRRWKERADRRIEQIENYFNNNPYHPGDVHLVTYGHVYNESQLKELEEKLRATSDIRYHGGRDDDDDSLVADLERRASLTRLKSFDEDTALRVALQRHRFHLAAGSEDLHSVEHKPSHDRFHDFIDGLEDWTVVPRRVSTRRISKLKSTRRASNKLFDHDRKGRRAMSKTNLDANNLTSLKLRIFPLGSDPMKSIIEGPEPIALQLAQLSKHSLTQNSGSIKSDSGPTTEDSIETASTSTATAWASQRQGSLALHVFRQRDINDDHRYAYVAFHKARTKGKVLQIQRKGERPEDNGEVHQHIAEPVVKSLTDLR